MIFFSMPILGIFIVWLCSVLIREEWSPEQVASRLVIEQGISISDEWIYQYIFADKRSGVATCSVLCAARKSVVSGMVAIQSQKYCFNHSCCNAYNCFVLSRTFMISPSSSTKFDASN